jgi:transposase
VGSRVVQSASRVQAWELNQEAIKEEEILDGRYWLMTTLEVSPKGVLDLYRSRDAVERGFRITKETIKIRPIWNRTEQHIKAHLFVCFIAYLLYSLLEIEARKQIAGITSVKMLDKLKILTRRAKRDIDTGEVGEFLSGMVDES